MNVALPAQHNSLLSYAYLEHKWSYGGKIALMARSLLNALSRSCPAVLLKANCPETIRPIVTRLKLSSLIGVPFSCVDLKSVMQTSMKNFQEGNWKAGALSAISASVISADILDSTTTFVNALLAQIYKDPPEYFTETSLPLAFYMVSAGSFIRGIRLVTAPKNASKHTLKIDALALLANGVIFVALVMFKRGVTSSAPFLLMTASFALRIAAVRLQHQKLKVE